MPDSRYSPSPRPAAHTGSAPRMRTDCPHPTPSPASPADREPPRPAAAEFRKSPTECAHAPAHSPTDRPQTLQAPYTDTECLRRKETPGSGSASAPFSPAIRKPPARFYPSTSIPPSSRKGSFFSSSPEAPAPGPDRPEVRRAQGYPYPFSFFSPGI